MSLLKTTTLYYYYLGKLVFKTIINTVNDELMNEYPGYWLENYNYNDNDTNNKSEGEMNRKLLMDGVIDNNDENDGEQNNINIDDNIDHDVHIYILKRLKENEDKENENEELEIMMKLNSNNFIDCDNNEVSRGGTNKKERKRMKRNTMYGLTVRIEE